MHLSSPGKTLLLALVILFLSACGNVGPAVSEAPLAAQEPAPPTEVTRVVPTPVPDQPVRIYSIVLSIGLDDDGTPIDDRDALPVNSSAAFLAVLVQDIPQGTEFEVEWLRDRETIGWSQHLVRERTPGEKWIALRFEPEEEFISGDYSARLTVNGKRVESLVFRVGSGRVAQPDAAPRLLFTTSWSIDDETIAAQSSFEYGLQQIVAVLSNPPAARGQFSSDWYLGDELITRLPAGATQTPSIRTFTLSSDDPLLPGRYRVSILAGGQHLLTASFTINRPPGADFEAAVVDLLITDSYEEGSGLPESESIHEFQPPADLYALVLITNLWPEDMVEVQWLRGEEHLASGRLTDQAISRSWISFSHSVPDPIPEPTTFRIRVLLNESLVMERELVALPD